MLSHESTGPPGHRRGRRNHPEAEITVRWADYGRWPTI